MVKTISVHPFATIGSTTVARYFVLIVLDIKLVIVRELKIKKKKNLLLPVILFLKIKQLLLLRLLRFFVWRKL